MFIESLIKPNLTKKPTRTVTLFGVAYEFIAVKNGQHYVAEVPNEDHAARFLANPKAFREFTDAIAGDTPTLARAAKPAAPAAPVAKPATPPPAPPAADAATETRDASSTASEDAAAAQALLSATPTLIKKALEKNCPPMPVLVEALRLEQAEPAKKQRAMVIACLKGAISTLESKLEG